MREQVRYITDLMCSNRRWPLEYDCITSDCERELLCESVPFLVQNITMRGAGATKGLFLILVVLNLFLFHLLSFTYIAVPWVRILSVMLVKAVLFTCQPNI
jgi:hypothetical protein